MIFEDEDIIVIKNKYPEAPVHLLVVPKKHFEWQDDFSEQDLSIITRLISLAKRISKEQGIDNSHKLIFNVGKTAHFPHVHLHLLAGWKDEVPQHNV